MSYERDIPTIIKCQCGKGKIIKESESNEWGQIKEYGPYIDCEECRKIYDISVIARSQNTNLQFII